MTAIDAALQVLYPGNNAGPARKFERARVERAIEAYEREKNKPSEPCEHGKGCVHECNAAGIN